MFQLMKSDWFREKPIASFLREIFFKNLNFSNKLATLDQLYPWRIPQQLAEHTDEFSPCSSPLSPSPCVCSFSFQLEKRPENELIKNLYFMQNEAEKRRKNSSKVSPHFENCCGAFRTGAFNNHVFSIHGDIVQGRARPETNRGAHV